MFADKALGLAFLCAALAAAEPQPSDSFQSDAWLHDVCFANPQCGWAVGDRGAIWATVDGGGHWELQTSEVNCPLYSVFFLDAQNGWAVGGGADPLVHTSSGVVLITHDGGKTWSRDPKLQIPVFRQVRFFDARRGWAVGLTSAMYPSGLFTTDSGGRSWQPVQAGGARAWLSASFLEPRTGVVVGLDSALAVLNRGGAQRLPGSPFGLRALHRVWLVPPQFGWIAGDGGLIAMTGDRGQTWQGPPSAPPPELASQFDWKAICVRGTKAWIAGSPGTRVLHSPDAGRAWHAFPTGQTLPISALTMVDDAQGWAVGALGSILHTADGGQTWRLERSGGGRAALLGLVSEPAAMPLELLARLSASEGYLAIVEAIGRSDVETPPQSRTPLGDRFNEAILAAGGSGGRLAWQFPLRDARISAAPEQIVDWWDRLHKTSGKALLQSHLVRQIRLWRPEIVVAEAPHDATNSAARLIGQAVADAVRQASDPQQFSEQIVLAGLAPWTVKRQFAVLPPGQRGAPELPTSQLAARLGRSLVDLADVGRSLLADRVLPAPPTIGFRQMAGVIDDAARDDFFRGIVLPVGGEARRNPPEAAINSLDALTKAAQRRRNILAILEKAGRDPLGDRQLLAQSDRLIEQLDADGAAWLLFRLAERYRSGGEWELAADAYRMTIERFPQHPLRRAALTRLVQHGCSMEAAWRARGAQGFRTESAQGAAVDAAELIRRVAQAAAEGSQIEASDPALFAEPSVRFPLAAASRNAPESKLAQRCYLEFSRTAEHDAWRQCAQGEAWLAERKTQPPKPLLQAAAATARPRLDGKLDEPLWRQAAAYPLRSSAGDDAAWPAQIQIAYDAEFLYLAVVCTQAPQAKYAAAAGVRPRDADLTQEDRVDLFLNIDRD